MITVEDLVKDFGPKRAVNRVSFQRSKGRSSVSSGPMAGEIDHHADDHRIFPPTSGRVVVGAMTSGRPHSGQAADRLSPRERPCYSDMTVHGFLAFAAEMRGLMARPASRRFSGWWGCAF